MLRRLVLIGLASIGMMTSSLALAGSAFAQDPDYAIPGSFRLPWAYAETHRVTWEPADHWANGKARGIAYDFSMDIGTPLYAPTDGWIYYLWDERPFATNYGHYVEIVSEDGDWLMRLAHLRDERHGEGPVRAGDLIGHSGISGVTAAHLHLELLVRKGGSWVRPDLARLDRLYGYPVEAIVEGALVANQEFLPSLDIVDNQLPFASGGLGEPISLSLPLRNTGAAALHLQIVQVALLHEKGHPAVAEVCGAWQLLPQEGLTLTVPVLLDRGGPWRVAGVTYQGQEVAGSLPAQGVVAVAMSPVEVAHLDVIPETCDTQRGLSFSLELVNLAKSAAVYDAIALMGTRPDGAPWRVVTEGPITLAASEALTLNLQASWQAGHVGVWSLDDVAGIAEGKPHYFDAPELLFTVAGPEIHVESVQVFETTDSLHIMLTLRNVGTRPIRPDSVEVWGWQPNDSDSFGGGQQVRMPIQPGSSARFLISVPTNGITGQWSVAGAGTWDGGEYRPLALPSEPIIDVPELALVSLLK